MFTTSDEMMNFVSLYSESHGVTQVMGHTCNPYDLRSDASLQLDFNVEVESRKFCGLSVLVARGACDKTSTRSSSRVSFAVTDRASRSIKPYL